MQHFADRLNAAVKRVGNPVLVGIDPRPESLPNGYRNRFSEGPLATVSALEAFCKQVIDVIAARVCAIKPQAAFFEQHGPPGMAALQAVARHAREKGLLVILDGKRNDIGTTAEAYAQAYLRGAPPTPTASQTRDADPTHWCSDALTVTPYLGSDGIQPFLKAAAQHGNGLFVLVRTSNPSAREFQDLMCDGKPLYRHVAQRLGEWAAPHFGASGYSLVGAVVGATYPQELAELRAVLPGVIFLVPGYGAQGGNAADVAAAFDENGHGAIINNSRGLVFAYQNPKFRDRAHGDWQRAVELALDDMIDDLATNTPAGRLRSR